MQPNQVSVAHNPSANRFEVRLEERMAILAYIRTGNHIALVHTEVPDDMEGRGIGSLLAQTALEYARENHLVVIPTCPFVSSFIQGHPEYRDLIS